MIRHTNKKEHHTLWLTVLLWTIASFILPSSSVSWSDTLIDSTGFERNEGYTLGDLNGQDQWMVGAGSAEVWEQVVQSGLQAARLTEGSSASRPLSTAGGSVSTRMYLQAVPSGQPDKIDRDRIALLYLDRALGLMAYSGRSNEWIATGFVPTEGSWFEIEITLHFQTATWDLNVNGQRRVTGMGFANPHVRNLYSFGINASHDGETLFDDFSAEIIIPGHDTTPPVIDNGTGFEPEEGYVPGNLDGQQGWHVTRGFADVWDEVVFSGVQAVRLQPDAEVVTKMPPAPNIHTFTTYLQATPSVTPELPNVPRSALVYLDDVHGIMGFNGDGEGGGEWVEAGVSPEEGTWFKLVIELNFDEKTWSAQIGDIVVLTDLGFHSDDVRTLSDVIVRSSAGGRTLMDAVRLDGSGVSDSMINDWDQM